VSADLLNESKSPRYKERTVVNHIGNAERVCLTRRSDRKAVSLTRPAARLLAVLAMALPVAAALAEDPHLSGDQLRAMMNDAQSQGQTGLARKTAPVDVRRAQPGEIIVTTIAGEGKETQSKPAEQGDWVVRNRCEQTGNEQYLVNSVKFADRYSLTDEPSPKAGEWVPAKPRGKTLRYFIVRDQDGDFTFEAPWGEPMVARPGDAIAQDPENERDIYRVAAESFRCTYEIIDKAQD
jgi:hypothetical protein